MSQNRPHINKLTKELIEAVQKSRKNKSELLELIEEIKFRTKARHKLAPTKIKAEKYLKEISMNAVIQKSNNKKLKRPNSSKLMIRKAISHY